LRRISFGLIFVDFMSWTLNAGLMIARAPNALIARVKRAGKRAARPVQPIRSRVKANIASTYSAATTSWQAVNGSP